jgi:signal peptidase I
MGHFTSFAPGFEIPYTDAAMRHFIISALEVIEVALVALGAVFLIRTFLVQPFLVSGASMVPNFADHDYLLVDELTYYFRKPQRGEVIVFRYPNDETTYFIKRIVGLPGDRVEIKDGKVKIANAEWPDGKIIEEPYLPAQTVTSAHPGAGSEFKVNEGQYLVLGDNRSFSFDSREWGLLSQTEIVGLVRLRLWPLKGFTVFASPKYQYDR